MYTKYIHYHHLINNTCTKVEFQIQILYSCYLSKIDRMYVVNIKKINPYFNNRNFWDSCVDLDTWLHRLKRKQRCKLVKIDHHLLCQNKERQFLILRSISTIKADGFKGQNLINSGWKWIEGSKCDTSLTLWG